MFTLDTPYGEAHYNIVTNEGQDLYIKRWINNQLFSQYFSLCNQSHILICLKQPCPSKHPLQVLPVIKYTQEHKSGFPSYMSFDVVYSKKSLRLLYLSQKLISQAKRMEEKRKRNGLLFSSILVVLLCVFLVNSPICLFTHPFLSLLALNMSEI